MDRNTFYDKYKRNKQSTTFYKSTAWRKLRKHVYNRDHGLCQYCIKDKKIVPADVVHHIEEITVAWDKRLDETNLISICHSCHNKQHGNKKVQTSRKIRVIKG